jgi:hypothetical protein
MEQASDAIARTSRTVTGEFNYLADPYRIEDGELLHYYADWSATTNVRLAPRTTPVCDARGLADTFSLDREGIALVRHASAMRSFADADAQGERYLAECEALIGDLTGAAAVFGGGLHCRFAQAEDPAERYDKGPAHYVHADYSDRSAPEFARYVAADLASYRRYAIYNLWRVVTPPPHRTPLAVCDAQSVAPGDALESNVVMAYPDSEAVWTQTLLYHPNPRHRWYYFSDIEPGEMLVFKSYDSDPARSTRVAHSAFVDPTVPPGHPRISIEARVLAGFA